MLYVMAGPPGAGKSTVADLLGPRINAPVLAVDTVDRALQAMGVTQSRPGVTAYVVVEAIAEDHLRRGQDVVVDAVNAVEAARRQWTALSERTGVPLRFVEVVCSDEAAHRSRVETRHAAEPWKPDWDAVRTRRRDPWTVRRDVFDSAALTAEMIVGRLVA